MLGQLLFSLQRLSPAIELSSRMGYKTLVVDIATLGATLLESIRFAPLVRLVIEQANDESIWVAVFDLIDQIRPTGPRTPPPSTASALSPFGKRHGRTILGTFSTRPSIENRWMPLSKLSCLQAFSSMC